MIALLRRDGIVVCSWGLLILCLAGPVFGDDPGGDEGWSYTKGTGSSFSDGEFNITLHARAQLLGAWENPELGDASASFDIPRFKIHAEGAVGEKLAFTVQAELTDSEASPRALEDAFLVYRYGNSPLGKVWVGQGKVPFGRQHLTSGELLQFVDRSIAANEFLHNEASDDGRDVGIALIGQNREKTYNYAVGVYNGNGINKDADDNTDYMVIGRLVVTPLGEYELAETDSRRAAGDPPEGRPSRVAVGVSARTLTVGTEAINEELRAVTAAFEFAYKVAGFNLVGEFFTRSADVPLGQASNEVDTDGWYLQAGWCFRSGYEVVGRYSEVLRDEVELDETEWGVGLNRYIWGHGFKLQLEYREVVFEGVQSTPRIDAKEGRIQLQLRF